MALFPKRYLDSLISVELEDKNGEKYPIASSFIFGVSTGFKDKKEKMQYVTFLITNRHVFLDDSGKYLEKVFLRFNVEDKAKHYPINLLDQDRNPIWIKNKNENVDIAALPLRHSYFGIDKVNYFIFTDDNFIIKAIDFDKIGISPGDGVFVLGFPMRLRGENKNLIIVRQGIVSRVDEETLKDHYFYVDSLAYPGNSGGPVISKPEFGSILGTTCNSSAKLIGVVSAGIPYIDVAVSMQTKRPRITFEEQTGLVKVVPVESIIETVDSYCKDITKKLTDAQKISTDTEDRTKGVNTEIKECK